MIDPDPAQLAAAPVGALDPRAPLPAEPRRAMVEAVEQQVRYVRQQCAAARAVARSGGGGDAGAVAFGVEMSQTGSFPDERPVFVIGAARSGTTAMLRALRDAANFFAWDEGHLLSALPTLLAGLRSGWLHRAATIPHPAGRFAFDFLDLPQLNRAVVQVFDETYRRATRQAHRARWADKTPSAEGVIAVPLLAGLYPQARFVYMHRHPVKLLLSRMRKVPHFQLPMGCVNYALITRLWLEVREVLPRQRYIEVAQADLALRPDAVAQALAPVLELTGAEAAGVADYFRRERPESTGSCDDAGELFLEDLDWSEQDKRFVLETCEAPASAFGYALRRGAGGGGDAGAGIPPAVPADPVAGDTP
jgi:hypothetical protein